MDPAGLIAAMPLGAMVIGPDGRIVAANAKVRDLFNKPLVGRDHVTALRRPELLDAIELARRTSQTGLARLLQRHSNADTVWQVTIAPVAGSFRAPADAAAPEDEPAETDGPALLVSFEDVTPLEEAEQMRRDFIANVSHELKSPLTALTGFIETLQGPARDDPQARERFLAIMSTEAQRMNRLVSDLLSLSRVEAGERQRPQQSVALTQLVTRTLATMRSQIEAQGAKVELSLPEDDIVLAGDPDQLQQVLSNLLENALKYGRKGGTVQVSLTPAQYDQQLGQDVVRLSVADEGEGIDPIHLPRLTERFYRVDTHRSRQSGGTGLGLAIVKHILGRHRGRLKIESQPGQGSRFTILLPWQPGMTRPSGD